MKFGVFHRLTKPGVTYGNLMTTVAGYLFAAQGEIKWGVFSALTIGTWAIIASACVINNYLDRDIDAVMARTKQRPILTGEVTPRQALIYGVTLGLVGVVILGYFTNLLVVAVGVLGWVTYVWLYGALSKRKSVHGTLVGAVSGAAPILAGYVAASGVVDLGAVLVFAALFFWQMPEFYSIAIYRKKEYAAAKIPLITIVKGVKLTIVHILFHTAAFVVSVLLLLALGYTSVSYAVIMGICCTYWLYLGVRGLNAPDVDSWSRRMFKFSMIVLLVFSLMISIDIYLP
jgi:protoheme IX farnesyltransferase